MMSKIKNYIIADRRRWDNRIASLVNPVLIIVLTISFLVFLVYAL